MDAAMVTCTAFQDVTWLPGSVCSFSDRLAVFRVALADGAACMPYLHQLLSPDEMERVGRYRNADDQLRFGCTRGLLRMVLGQYVDQLPECVEFVPGVNRKPVLKKPAGWYFNVSHSGAWSLIAVGRSPVGVDLEWVNPDFPFLDVLPASFSPHEQRHLDACGNARQDFYQLWTRKEALVKATAKGMDEEFSQIPSLTGTHAVDPLLIGQRGHWMVNGFAAADGYLAALAYDRAWGVNPRFYALDSALFLAGSR